MKVTISKKIILGFLTVISLMFLISSLSIFTMRAINSSYSDMIERRAVIVSTLKDIQLSLSQESIGLRGILINEEGAIDYITESSTSLNMQINALNELLQSPEDREELNRLTEMNKSFNLQVEEVIELMKNDPNKARALIREEISTETIVMWNIAEDLQKKQSTLMEKEKQANTKTARDAVLEIVFLSIFSIILALLVSLMITRAITKPIRSLKKEAETIAAGDLTGADIAVVSKDEIGQMTASFNQMKENLSILIQQTLTNAEELVITSRELSLHAYETERATEQTASALQGVAAGSEKQMSSSYISVNAITEIADQMSQAAQSIQSVAELISLTDEKAATGQEIVLQTMKQMSLVQDGTTKTSDAINHLGEKSTEIGQIVEMITQIASQTNLLALNATIEAAQAKEHGKGFAVVASEVRKLAQQSSSAAWSIQSLIHDIQTATQHAVQSIHSNTIVIKEGMKMADQTKKAFTDIAESVKVASSESQQVAQIVEQVSMSSQDTKKIVSEISEVSKHANLYVQQVATSSEEQHASMQDVATAAEKLSNMAMNLQESTRYFKVKNSRNESANPLQEI